MALQISVRLHSDSERVLLLKLIKRENICYSDLLKYFLMGLKIIIRDGTIFLTNSSY